MPVPTHHNNICETRIVPMRCQFCRDKVYFFTCTCGSKVFFDLPEPPWNPHERHCYRYLMWHLQEIENTPILEIRSIIERYSQEIDIEIPIDVYEFLNNLEGKRSRFNPKIVNVEPGKEQEIVIGQVISLNHQVNFFKRFKLAENQFGRALLGNLLNTSCIELKLRQQTKTQTLIYDYQIFVPTRIFNIEPFRKDNIVFAVITPFSVHGRETIWLCSEIRVIQNHRS